MEDKLNTLIMDLLENVQESTDCMPNMYEGLRCFPFEIEVKKTGASSVKVAGSSFLGGIFKKFTN